MTGEIAEALVVLSSDEPEAYEDRFMYIADRAETRCTTLTSTKSNIHPKTIENERLWFLKRFFME